MNNTNTKLKTAIAYIRVSTDAQGDKFGFDAQKEAIDKYAAENGYHIIRYHEEIGSGAKERPVLEEIIFSNEVQNPPIETLLVYKNDRVARDTNLYFYYLYKLETKGVKLVSVVEDFAGIPPEFAGVYRALLQFVAEQERSNITRRTSAGRMVKAQSGGYAGGRCPYGYRVEDKTLVVDERESGMVLRIFDLLDRGWSLNRIAETLSMEGYRARSGSRLQATNIMLIRDNRKFYEGYYRYGGTDWVKGDHEPLLP